LPVSVSGLKGDPKGSPFCIDRQCSTCGVQDAQKQTDAYRPNENAIRRAWLDNPDTRAAYDANCGKIRADAATETTADKGGGSPSRQGDNHAAKLPPETARRPKAQDAALVSGIDFPMEIVKVRQPFHCQAMLVFLAIEVHFHQVPGKPFADPLGLGAICKSAIDDQRAING
jgi:hypothetical protein